MAFALLNVVSTPSLLAVPKGLPPNLSSATRQGFSLYNGSLIPLGFLLHLSLILFILRVIDGEHDALHNASFSPFTETPLSSYPSFFSSSATPAWLGGNFDELYAPPLFFVDLWMVMWAYSTHICRRVTTLIHSPSFACQHSGKTPLRRYMGRDIVIKLSSSSFSPAWSSPFHTDTPLYPIRFLSKLYTLRPPPVITTYPRESRHEIYLPEDTFSSYSRFLKIYPVVTSSFPVPSLLLPFTVSTPPFGTKGLNENTNFPPFGM